MKNQIVIPLCDTIFVNNYQFAGLSLKFDLGRRLEKINVDVSDGPFIIIGSKRQQIGLTFSHF